MAYIGTKVNDSWAKSFANALQNSTQQSKVEMNVTDPEYVVIFTNYIDPVMLAVIIISGLVLNGTLLTIFVRHREIRTTANIMILNLAICDILNVCINAPIHYVYPHYRNNLPILTCRFFMSARQFLSSISAISLVALSIQRFCATFSFNERKFLSNKCQTGLFIGLVWAISLVASVAPTFIKEYYERVCSNHHETKVMKTAVVTSAIFYCVVYLALIVSFNLLTARRLRLSAQQMLGEHWHKIKSGRNKSASVVTSMAVLYVVSYVPYWIWCVVVFCYELNKHTGVVLCTGYVAKYLLFAHSCLNPVALYISSNTFKSYFRRYLCYSRN